MWSLVSSSYFLRNNALFRRYFWQFIRKASCLKMPKNINFNEYSLKWYIVDNSTIYDFHSTPLTNINLNLNFRRFLSISVLVDKCYALIDTQNTLFILPDPESIFHKTSRQLIRALVYRFYFMSVQYVSAISLAP